MILAIDIGGTKTLIALFNSRGRVIRRLKFPTAPLKDQFFIDLTSNLTNFTKFNIDKVVCAIPGTVQKNCSVRLGNRNWGTFSLLPLLKNLFNCPILFENDANLASIYESNRLRGKTVFLTFSTGIGGGIAENGHLLSESASFEPGHWKFKFDGEKKEWEDIAAASAIGTAYGGKEATSLRGTEIMRDIASRIELGLPKIIDDYYPKTIILGGPMGKIFKLYSDYLPRYTGVRYRRPRRPLESVIYGCYLLGKRS